MNGFDVYKTYIALKLHFTKPTYGFFKFRDGRHPLIMRLLLQRTITIETFILMNKLLSFFDLFDKEMGDDIMWNEMRFKCEKYAPFLPKGDLAKYREITMRVARKNGLYS